EELRDQYEELAAGGQRVRESQERYRSIIENSPYGMHFYDLDPGRGLVFAGANPAADRILGISHELLVGKTILEAFPGLTETEIPAKYRDVAESGIPWQTEQVIYDKGVIHGAFSVTAFRPARGSMTAMFLDITGRKKAEMERQESEERLRLFIQQAPVAIAMFDNDMRYLAASRRWLADNHLGDRDIAGRSHYEIFPNLPEDLKDAHRRALAGEVISSSEYRYVHENGAVQWFTWEVRPWYTKGKIVGGIILFSEDITGRKTAEDALNEKTEELDRFFSASLDLFCIAGIDGTFRRLNPEWERTLGYTLAELEGHRFLDFVHPDDLDATRAAVGELSSQKSVLNFTNRYRRRDGSYRWIEWRSFPRGDLIFAAARDITERKQFEDALQQSRAELSAILEGTPVLQFVIGRDHRIIAWNKALEKYSGIPAAEVLGTTLQWRAFYSEKRPVLADLLVDNNTDDLSRWYGGKLNPAPHVEGGYEATDFFPAMGPSGTWLMFTAAPVRDADGTIIGAVETLNDVTDRVRATEALRESEKRYRDLFEITNAVMLIIDRDTATIVEGNAAACRYYGYTPEELRGLPVSAINTLDTDDIRREMDRAASRDGLVFQFRHRKKSGEIRDVEVFSAPVTIAGKLLLHSIVQDITERKQAEEALRASEERLRLFIRHAPAALAMFDTGMRYIAASRRWMADYHLGDSDIAGHSHYEIFPELPEPLKAIHRRGLAGEVISSAEDRFVRSDGSVQWLAWEVRPWYTTGNTIGGIIIYSEDITRRKEVEESLRESEEKYRSLVDVSPVAVAVHRDGKVVYANPEAVRLLKAKTAEDLIGKSVLPFIHPDYRKKALDDFRSMADTGRMIPLQEEVLLATTGEPFTVEVVAKPIRYEGLPSVLVAFRDITERKHAETCLQEAWRKLALLNSLTRHDIRNQLITLQGFTQFAKMTEQDTTIAGYLEKIDTCATTIRGQIEFMKTYHELGVNASSWSPLDAVVKKACIK
ncbi:PAS domain S-box protein, partial [Methanoregula sp.]|uniref:PAS domain S-box protein n=1 Tax=Methanoregula sp. TaxID=2052170 RepID=UPI000CB0CC1F